MTEVDERFPGLADLVHKGFGTANPSQAAREAGATYLDGDEGRRLLEALRDGPIRADHDGREVVVSMDEGGLRIQDPDRHMLELDDLGAKVAQSWSSRVRTMPGLHLVAGAPSSGRRTTLAALVRRMASEGEVPTFVDPLAPAPATGTGLLVAGWLRDPAARAGAAAMARATGRPVLGLVDDDDPFETTFRKRLVDLSDCLATVLALRLERRPDRVVPVATLLELRRD